eukprot:scaffold8269_cov21-Prasinocladus_malaysianus.AAC.3
MLNSYHPAGKLPAICGPQGRVGRLRRPVRLAGQRTAEMNTNGFRGGSNRCANQPLSRPAYRRAHRSMRP